MLNVVKDAFGIYRQYFSRILLVGITVGLPVMLAFSFAVQYTSLPFNILSIPLWPNLIHLFFMLICYTFIQIPYISMAIQWDEDDEITLRRAYGDTLKHMFPVYIYSLVYAISVMAGMFLLLIPGLVFLILWLPVPYAVIVENEGWRKGIEHAVAFSKANFWKISGLMLLFAIADIFGSVVVYLAAAILTNMVLMVTLSLMFVNILLLPLFIFTVTLMYIDWIRQKEDEKSTVRDPLSQLRLN